jgi:hypothetical protein
MMGKDQRIYRDLIPTVLERWEDVKLICSQASRFEEQVAKCMFHDNVVISDAAG